MFVVKIVLAIAWGVPWAAAGIVCCVTILGIPIGLLCFGIAGYPLSRVVKTQVRKHEEYINRDRPMETDEDEPWIK
jgi:uncharacterized membrane protein YccF (DUF307 family)